MSKTAYCVPIRVTQMIAPLNRRLLCGGNHYTPTSCVTSHVVRMSGPWMMTSSIFRRLLHGYCRQLFCRPIHPFVGLSVLFISGTQTCNSYISSRVIQDPDLSPLLRGFGCFVRPTLPPLTHFIKGTHCDENAQSSRSNSTVAESYPEQQVNIV